MKKLCLFALAAFGMSAFATLSVAQGLDDPIPANITQKGGVKIQLKPIATGLTAPNWGAAAPGDKKNLYVTDQDGILWAVDIKTGAKRAFLDVKDRLVPLGVRGPGSFDERGLLGIAFHPRYRDNGLLYTFTSERTDVGTADFAVPLGAAANCHTTITEWRVPSPGSADATVDKSTARVLMRIAKPQFNHNGGAVAFGPDGMLYIATGDGGAADDQGAGHVAGGNAQDRGNLLGKILRIDPRGTSAPNGQYSVPQSNPFAPASGPRGGAAGCEDGVCDEIYAYGLRNPFRMSFDREKGTLITGDVGQNDIEEVNVVRAGGNYGWPLKEGTFFFNDNGTGPGFVTDVDPGVPAGLIEPIAQYDHDEGISVIGGFVYRGDKIGGLKGRYVFGDYVRNFGGNNGRLFHLKGKNKGSSGFEGDGDLRDIREFRLQGQDGVGLSVLGFGEDANGELYVMANGTGVPFGSTGVILKIVKADDDDDEDDDDDD